MKTKALELAKVKMYLCWLSSWRWAAAVFIKDKVIFITELLNSSYAISCFLSHSLDNVQYVCRGHVQPVIKSELDTGMCPCLIYEKGPLCVKKGQENECSVMHGSGYVRHSVCKVWGQRLQMGHNEWVRPEKEISFLVLSIFQQYRNPSALWPVRTTTILVIAWRANWNRVYLTSASSSDRQTGRQQSVQRVTTNTEQRHKDKSVIFQLNHDNVLFSLEWR